uniref:Uncharacterized protein n=1 Tax=Cacopsylla melanoneura TaxID=428564 RepID=A0A8D8PR80_9HEMI
MKEKSKPVAPSGALLPNPPASQIKMPLLPTPTNIPNTPGYIEHTPPASTMYGAPSHASVTPDSTTNPAMMLNLPNINMNQDEVSRLLSSLQSSAATLSPLKSSQPSQATPLSSVPFPGQPPSVSTTVPNVLTTSNALLNTVTPSLTGSNTLPTSENVMHPVPLGPFPQFGVQGPNMGPPGGPFPPGMPLPGMMRTNIPPFPPMPSAAVPPTPSEPVKPPSVKRDPRLSRSSATDAPRPLVPPKPSPTPTDHLSLLKDIDLRLPAVTPLSSSLGTGGSGDTDLRNLIQTVPVHDACREIDATIGSHPPITWSLKRWEGAGRSACNYTDIAPLAKPNPLDPRLDPSRNRRRRSSDEVHPPASPSSSVSPSIRDPRAKTSLPPARRADPRIAPERRTSDPRSSERPLGTMSETRLSPRDSGASRYPADPRKRADPRSSSDEFRYQPNYSNAHVQDSDLRKTDGTFQDTDHRMTPQSGYHHS